MDGVSEFFETMHSLPVGGEVSEVADSPIPPEKDVITAVVTGGCEIDGKFVETSPKREMRFERVAPDRWRRMA